MTRYRSPDVTGHESTIKALVRDFLTTAAKNPDYNAANVVHDAVVYVMARKPAHVPRVDGAVVQTVLAEMIAESSKTKKAKVEEAGQAPRGSAVKTAVSFLNTLKNKLTGR